jgi:hypothetical protein
MRKRPKTKTKTKTKTKKDKDKKTKSFTFVFVSSTFEDPCILLHSYIFQPLCDTPRSVQVPLLRWRFRRRGRRGGRFRSRRGRRGLRTKHTSCTLLHIRRGRRRGGGGRRSRFLGSRRVRSCSLTLRRKGFLIF